MSRGGGQELDRASHGGAEAAGGAFSQWTTDGIPAAERLDYWREDVLRRVEPRRALDTDRPFQASLRRISGTVGELVEHASDGLTAERTAARCARDDCDDIIIDLMLECTSACLEQQGSRRVRSGDIHVIDYARPSEMVRSRHRAIALILPRAQVCAVLGSDLSALAGRHFAGAGMAAVLGSHMRASLDNAPMLSATHRRLSVNAAVDMALAMLQAEQCEAAVTECFPQGFYAAATRLIEATCTDPSLTPDVVAARLGCSRAALYRTFALHGESVSAFIWSRRLDHARRMLASAAFSHLLISQIAFRCGFLEHPTFNRMFKRRYGMTPREARHSSRRAHGDAAGEPERPNEPRPGADHRRSREAQP
ncbi:helix-turn-helix domain-containing protein [Aquabacter sp. CN5-332]|uniref:helix-turn-helix domain-containing protein n=1 Tax=Aquabacter sp. CN5-332 TaxID=3156608 RepID=UPI0032B47314